MVVIRRIHRGDRIHVSFSVPERIVNTPHFTALVWYELQGGSSLRLCLPAMAIPLERLPRDSLLQVFRMEYVLPEGLDTGVYTFGVAIITIAEMNRLIGLTSHARLAEFARIVGVADRPRANITDPTFEVLS